MTAPVMWTFCSGIGAPEVSAPWARHALACEIDDFARAVLVERLGHTDKTLFGDMAAFSAADAIARGIQAPDLIVAGTPCQSFSVAGKRRGLADARGNLTLRYLEILHETAELARSAGRKPPVAVWENVPGVLSDRENAFGCFLGEAVGADDALLPAGGESWPGAGMVAGPRARLAWRILDAQYLGVPQRRRRLFVVIDLGNGTDPAAVLFEPESLRWNPPPRRGEGQDVAGALSASPSTSRSPNEDATLIASTGHTSHCLNAGGMGRQDYETETLIAHTLRGEGFDASEDGTGRGTPLVAHCFDARQSDVLQYGDKTGPIDTDGHTHAVAQGITIHGTDKTATAVSFTDIAGSLRTKPPGSIENSSTTAVLSGPMVRRLTPTECERLQEFPDGWTDIPWKGGKAPDGRRYKALGNSMHTGSIGWILNRIQQYEALRSEQAA